MSSPDLFQRSDNRPLTVSELTALIKENLEGAFPDVYVAGEVSQFTRASSGHVYLTLKDEGAVLRAVMWRGTAQKLRFALEEGLEVIARGSIDVYAPRGSYQLIVSWMEPRGLGALQLAFRQLRERLEKEGLFATEQKKPLPPFPRRIAVVTSPTGAAVRDVINVVRRRCPSVEVYVYPTRVQGEGAASEVAAAIERLNQALPQLDLMIVGRGGGSLEDLWAFNEEIVARAIFRSRIPVISAVGHEVDFSISDFVADVRAATPTEAAELAVPDRQELAGRLRHLRRRLALVLHSTITRARQRLSATVSRYAFRHPEVAILDRAQRADDMLERAKSACSTRLRLLRETLVGTGRRLEALSPLKVLQRGYSVTFGPDGSLLRSVDGLRPGDTMTTRVHRGRISSEVLTVEPLPPSRVKDSQSDD